MEQKVILLACAAGMSTSLLVTKMQEVSKKDKIFAIPVSKVDQKVNEESIDVILIGPQIRYMEKRIKEKIQCINATLHICSKCICGNGKAVWYG
mgnify:FL=1